MLHYRSVLSAAVFVMAVSTSVDAQAPAGPGVFGVYNPVTGTFQPAPIQAVAPAPGSVEPAAQVVRAGTIRFRVLITVMSGSPASTLPFCFLSYSHGGVQQSYSESQNLQGTRTGNDARCIINIPYRWTQANDANPVNLSISLTVGSRSHFESLPPIRLPPNGATTIITVNVTA